MAEDIGTWLQGVGFGKYEAVFRHHDIGLDVLNRLTEDHLSEMGISIGDRLRLIAAIEALSPSGQTTLSSPENTMDAEPAPAPQVRSTEAERRPLTVMFCDLADSTALSSRLDPEDLQEVIRSYQETCAVCISAYEGYIAKYMGDGILVYFGYPTAQERSTERAIRSALAIIDAMSGLSESVGARLGIDIAVRIGIASGTVMVGEILGEGTAQERTVIGEAPNIAARLQGLAGRNGVVVSALTKELGGDVFVYESMGLRDLKGIEEPIETWSVSGFNFRADDEVFVDDHDVIAAPDLIGRDEEIGLLRRVWQDVKDGAGGQVATVSGEAGVGKSSLIAALKAEVRTTGAPVLTIRCSPYHVNSALYPVTEHFRMLAGWRPEDDDTARLQKLETMLGSYGLVLGDSVPLVASLLSLPLPEARYRPIDLSPQEQKAQTLEVLVSLSLAISERTPFLQLWEDLHWTDPSTLEFLGLLIDQAPMVSLFIVTTARPDFTPPWPSRSHVTPIALSRLEPAHAARLADRIAGKPLPATVTDHIFKKTDGVPLFVEELTKTILASGVLRDGEDGFELNGSLAELRIPETLQDSLMARLDRLPDVRELAQIGAVVGREFTYEIVTELAGIAEAALQDGLARLVEAELLYQRGLPPRAKYIFKHALVRDAAYSSLLRRARQELHRRLAELLDATDADLVENQPELIAHHFREAGQNDKAINYLFQAGERSLLRSANKEAVTHFEDALSLIRQMPDREAWERTELNILIKAAPALTAVRGYTAPEIERTFQRAGELSRIIGETEMEFSVILGQSMFQMIRGDLLKARELAQAAEDLAGRQKALGSDLAAARQMGITLCFLGELTAARTQLEHVADNYRPEVHGASFLTRTGSDFGVGATSVLGGFVLPPLGYPNQGVTRCAQALEIAQQLDHPFSIAFAHWCCAYLRATRGDFEAFEEHASKLETISETHGFAQYFAWIKGQRGHVLLRQDAVDQAIENFEAGLSISRKLGSTMFDSGHRAGLAEAYGRVGRVDDGLTTIAEGLAHVGASRERYYESNLLWARGDLALLKDGSNDRAAEADLRRSIEVARSQGAAMWELRGLVSLAELLPRHREEAELRERIGAILNGLTEGTSMNELRSARAILNVSS